MMAMNGACEREQFSGARFDGIFCFGSSSADIEGIFHVFSMKDFTSFFPQSVRQVRGIGPPDGLGIFRAATAAGPDVMVNDTQNKNW
jgi:hypothetical protein